MGFEFAELDLKGAYLIDYFYAGDNRGDFTKSFERDIYKNAGIEFSLSETFTSRSMKNVIRGLHFQFSNPQAKIVTVVAGKIWDVIVDLRLGSNTFKEWRAFDLSADNHLGLYVPKGFAHGFACLEDDTVMLYQCEGRYSAKMDSGIIFNEPEIGIKWPIDLDKSIHSTRDLNLLNWEKYIQYITYNDEQIFGGGGASDIS